MMTQAGRRKEQRPMLIKVSKNGPYLVSESIPLTQKIILYDAQSDSCQWQDGKTYPQQENYALCRCGQSNSKPYCDGTHLKVHFNGTETATHDMYRTQAVIIDGPVLRLTDAKIYCASARFCHRAGGIWTIIPRSDKPDDKQIAIEEAADCPSGRLVVHEKSTGKPIEPAFEPSIVVIEDPSMNISGPLWVRGRIPITASDGTTYEVRNRVTLCRCGKSTNKPFCDSSHWPEDSESNSC
jgi:CDGSH-type Zn-finger protein